MMTSLSSNKNPTICSTFGIPKPDQGLKMGNTLFSWSGDEISEHDSPGEKVWKASKAGKVEFLNNLKEHLNEETQHYVEWRDEKSGLTPLMVAACHENHECVRLLLNANALVNSKDTSKEGNTALHYACLSGSKDSVKFLVNTPGIKMHALNNKGFSPLDLARKQYASFNQTRNLEAMQVLEEVIQVYKGWLYQSAENIVSKTAGISALNTWNKRFCVVSRTGNSEYLEMAFYKAPSSGMYRSALPAFTFWFFVPKGCSKLNKWFNSRPLAYEISGMNKSDYCSAVIKPRNTITIAAMNEQEAIDWDNFLNKTAANIVATEVRVPSREARVSSRLKGKMSTIQMIEQFHALANSTSSDQLGETPESHALTSSSVASSQEIVMNEAQGSNTEVPTSSNSSVDDECIVCMENRCDAVCVPCGHNVCCIQCLTGIKEKSSDQATCPMCRDPLEQALKIFK